MKMIQKLISSVTAAAVCFSVLASMNISAEDYNSAVSGRAIVKSSGIEGDIRAIPALSHGEMHPKCDTLLPGIVLPESNESYSEELGASTDYTSYYVTTILGNEITAAQKAKVEEKGTEIISHIDPNWTTVQKLAYINDYICTHMYYDYTYDSFNVYESIVNGKGVCSGYARAFWYLCYRLGIDCRLIGSSALDHQWNLVKVDGSWYHVDTTWNENGNIPDYAGEVIHKYFLSSDSWMKSSEGKHYANDWQFYENGMPSANGYATSARYDEMPWKKDSICSMALYGTDIYFFAGADDQRGLYKADKNMNITRVVDFSNTWWTDAGKNGIYSNCYSGVGIYNGKLYFNNSYAVFMSEPDGTNIRKVFEMSDEDYEHYRLYGFWQEGSVLRLMYDSMTPGNTSYYAYLNGVEVLDLKKIHLDLTKTAKITVHPVAKTVEYKDDGEKKSVFTPGQAEHGRIVYTTDHNTWYYWEGDLYGYNADSYTIYYKVMADAPYIDSPEYELTATIAVKKLTGAEYKNGTVNAVYSLGNETIREAVPADKVTPELIAVMDKNSCISYVRAISMSSDTTVLTAAQMAAIRRVI